MLIFAPYRFKCCNLHDQKHFSLIMDMTTPKRWILSFVFTVLCLCKYSRLPAQAAQAHFMNADVTLACERCCVTNGYLQRFVWDANGFS